MENWSIRPVTASTGEAPDLAEQALYEYAQTRATKRPWTLIQIVIFMVGFSEGLTHLATLAIYYLFKDDLGLSPSQVSLLFVAPSFPWFLKPLFAFYSDSYPIFGMRRKPYLLFFSALQAAGYVLLAFTVTGVMGAVLALFLIAFSSAFCSAIAEALVVETTEGERSDASRSVADFTFAKGFGSLLVAYFSGYLLEKVSKRDIFLMTSSFPLIITVTGIFMIDVSELFATKVNMGYVVFNRLWCVFYWNFGLGPSVFILAFMCGPDYDDALFFYYTNVLNFGPSFMGTLRFTYGFAAIAGTLLYRYILHRTPYRQLLCSSILCSLPIYLSPLLLISGLNLKMGISDKVFVLSGGFLNEAVAEIQLLPLLVLTACICPPGLEGSAYSTMLAVRNLGSAISKGSSAVAMSALGITAARFDKLMEYIWLCGAFNLLPFIFLHLIPSEEEIDAARIKKIKSREDGFSYGSFDMSEGREQMIMPQESRDLGFVNN